MPSLNKPKNYNQQPQLHPETHTDGDETTQGDKLHMPQAPHFTPNPNSRPGYAKDWEQLEQYVDKPHSAPLEISPSSPDSLPNHSDKWEHLESKRWDDPATDPSKEPERIWPHDHPLTPMMMSADDPQSTNQEVATSPEQEKTHDDITDLIANNEASLDDICQALEDGVDIDKIIEGLNKGGRIQQDPKDTIREILEEGLVDDVDALKKSLITSGNEDLFYLNWDIFEEAGMVVYPSDRRKLRIWEHEHNINVSYDIPTSFNGRGEKYNRRFEHRRQSEKGKSVFEQERLNEDLKDQQEREDLEVFANTDNDPYE